MPEMCLFHYIGQSVTLWAMRFFNYDVQMRESVRKFENVNETLTLVPKQHR